MQVNARIAAPEMNRLEAAWASVLELERRAGRYQWVKFEGVRFVLARKTQYTPDFLVLTAEGEIEAHETKGGFFRDDARVKVKTAARLFPWCKFKVIKKEKSGWKIEELRP